jgi:chloramphenicol-sensitive protein RarD
VSDSRHAEAKKGALAALLCYLLWGLVPLYWKQLASIDALELIAHRHVWSLVVLAAVASACGSLRGVLDVLRSRRATALHVVSAVLLTVNWLVYVHGVNTGRVTDCSLGYYLVPLVNVAVGRFVLHERLSNLQWFAIAVAAVGVVLLVVELGQVPWIALALAGSWGGYSLLRKRSTIAALPALTAETLLLSPFAIAFLGWAALRGEGALGHVDAPMHALVFSSGLVTALPLMLFAYGAMRIRLATLGLLQYVAPTVQLLLGCMASRFRVGARSPSAASGSRCCFTPPIASCGCGEARASLARRRSPAAVLPRSS